LPLVYSIFLAGCATPAKYQISEELNLSRSSFELIDKRDEVQKKSESMSYLVSSCWYGIFRLGDDQFVPSALTFLTKELNARLGTQLQGKKVVVNRFEVFNNTGLSNVSTYNLFGIASGSGCQSAFSPERNPNNLPAIYINVDLDIGGKIIRDKIVQIEPVGNDRIDGPVTTDRVRRAMAEAVKRIVDPVSR
jgi:hypothetical protein